MNQDITITHAKEIVARQHTDALTSMNDEREFVDFFHDHRNDFLDDDHQVLHDGVLILLHAVEENWHSAVVQIVDFFGERMAHSHWVTGLRTCTTTTMADIFLARQRVDQKKLIKDLIWRQEPNVFKHCLTHLLRRDPDCNLGGAAKAAVRAKRLDNLMILDPHLNEDKRMKVLYWAAALERLDIVDAFYTTERGRWIANTNNPPQEIKQLSPVGMAYLESKIRVDADQEAITKSVGDVGQSAKARKI